MQCKPAVSPSRPFLSFMSFPPARWWHSALGPEVCSLNLSTRRVFRFAGTRYMASSNGVEGEESGQPDRRLPSPPANDLMISLGQHSAKKLARYGDGYRVHSAEDEMRAKVDINSGDACRTSLEIIDSEQIQQTKGKVVGTGCKIIDSELIQETKGEVVGTGCTSGDDKETSDADLYSYPALASSSHRDGSIYKGTNGWKEEFCVTDRNETRVEAMVMLSTLKDSYIHDSSYLTYMVQPMFQIFSVKLSKVLVGRDSAELYGYIAVRDNMDRLLNYVVNYSRDEPIIIEQGSLLNMTGPKRGIEFYGVILIEYDMRIKIGEQEKDDLQLIDGATYVDKMDAMSGQPITWHIDGSCGAVDITGAYIGNSLEATVEIVVSYVQDCFRMCLDCFSSGLHEEIRLFDGAIMESRALKRSVVAIMLDTQLDLKFKFCVDPSILVEHNCSFSANKLGRVTEEIKTDFALISVNVTWSPLPDRWPHNLFP